MADLRETLEDLRETEDVSAQFSKSDAEKNKTMCILAYIGWLVLVPLICAKDSKYARFHANQGLVLAIAETLISFVLGIFGRIILIGWIFRLVRWLLLLGCVILAVKGIMTVCAGKAEKLPVIGGVQILK